jgi:ribosomal protein L37AE/L43A
MTSEMVKKIERHGKKCGSKSFIRPEPGVYKCLKCERVLREAKKMVEAVAA